MPTNSQSASTAFTGKLLPETASTAAKVIRRSLESSAMPANAKR
eukprot:CAMPEP_0117604628 /NCGR_PEP_ID=MMETSP0784-20121206/78784_1 /TAXON_ID=39447 /ORGANISM="" /LENGTH=43 /DNA_ID= /DNA_START= /DNA_END= /DNA_ORIENTATION=